MICNTCGHCSVMTRPLTLLQKGELLRSRPQTVKPEMALVQVTPERHQKH